MIVGDTALPANGRCDWCIDLLGECFQFLLGTGNHNTATANKQRLFRLGDQLRRRFNGVWFRPRASGRIPPIFRFRPDVRLVHGLTLYVERQSNVCGPGPSGGHFLKGPAHDARYVHSIVDDLREFRERAEHRFLIQLRQRITTATGNRDIRGNSKNRDRRFVRLD